MPDEGALASELEGVLGRAGDAEHREADEIALRTRESVLGHAPLIGGPELALDRTDG